jgi:predicted small integral membrane protein
MLRIVKILLVLSEVAWGLLGALGNLTGWKGTVGAVAAVTSMATVSGGAQSWQATTNPLVILAGAAFIPIFKLTSSGLCMAGAWRMWAQRRSDAEAFARSKSLALAGCGIAVLGLFGGWIVIGEGWFELWRSPTLGHEASTAAFLYGGFIALIGLLVATRDD